MKYSLVQFDDLPDEILVYIFKQLKNIEVLYYLLDVNQRLNKILHDPIFTSAIHFFMYCSKNNFIYRLADPVVDRFCSRILPQIGHQIKSLWLEETSVSRILRATNYPNLNSLALIGLNVAKSLFIDEYSLLNTFKSQISTLQISFAGETDSSEVKNVYQLIFAQIVTNFTNLRCLEFHLPLTNLFDGLDLKSHPVIISSTLLELHIRVETCIDCLYLLDGRFDQLRAFYVKICKIHHFSIADQHKKKPLPNLQIFSLESSKDIYGFDQSFLSLLHRMINLEELNLNITVICKKNFIDSNTLKKHIVSYMQRLQKFTFNILSIVYHHYHQINFPSNLDIQDTFQDFYNNQMITCVDHFHEKIYSQCYIYSYPYKLTYYDHVTNNFSGGLFKSVTNVSLYDERPFEYQFFLRIAQSFPFLKELRIENEKAQNNEESLKSNKNNQSLSLIEYPNLTTLIFFPTHVDYVELFLLDSKVCLPNNVHLSVEYESMERVTNGFTRDATRNTCAKLRSLRLCSDVQVDERIKNYFPRAYIC